MWSTLRRCVVDDKNYKSEDNTDGSYVDFTELKHPVVGTRLPVVPFISNNGETSSLFRCCTGELVGFDVVRRKHLLICCVSLPLKSDYYSFNSIMEAYSDLPRDNFEMVLVANSDCEQGVFQDFFSKLPCLAVPFTDVNTRRHICSFIGLAHKVFSPKLSAVLVDPEETVLHNNRATAEYFLSYGSEWFPFRQSDADDINKQDHVLRFRLDPYHKKWLQHRAPKAAMLDPLIDTPLSLHRDILLCDPNLALPRIGSADESLTVSELSTKHVGLYLFFEYTYSTYTSLTNLIETYKECVEKNLELEILVVHIPLFDPTYSNLERLVEDLREQNITSWLLFPKHNKVWRRLWRAFGLHYFEDRLIILSPDGKPGEIEGMEIVEQMGVTEYPFTKTCILERRFAALKSLTPASLFKGPTKIRTCLIRKGKPFNVRQSSLQGKKLLVYLDWLQFSDDGGKLCRQLKELYPEIKARGWEVVFVPLNRKLEARGLRNYKFPNMLWPVMPLRETWKASVPDKLILKGEDGYGNLLVAFGEDGKIVSREAMKRLMEHGLDDSLFDDKLYEEIAAHLLCFAG